ncbi:hypothetical protein NPIL_55771 [Nephila pilipes]|uniref:Uncharacterized protein n=1 Tax=Nephila pilipes TaxID=299642 RepID=A0A8X6UFM0_NEPPI|nr:hypothetical protein NPIL_55771 [Nephila pilipes]
MRFIPSVIHSQEQISPFLTHLLVPDPKHPCTQRSHWVLARLFPALCSVAFQSRQVMDEVSSRPHLLKWKKRRIDWVLSFLTMIVRERVGSILEWLPSPLPIS